MIDTSALYALLVENDDAHAIASAAVDDVLREGLITHNYVVVEAASLVDRRLGRAAARELLDRLLAPVDVAFVDADIHRLAVAAFSAGAAASLVDCVSFEVMRRRGITRAFAFDRHFADAGFELVP